MTADCYDGLDKHLAHEPDLARAVVPMGMLMAWCAKLHLLSPDFVQQHERLVLRVRVEEALGSELLVASGGDLQRAFFTPKGQQFLDSFYPEFSSVYAQLLGEPIYHAADNWDNYRLLAADLTKRLMGANKQEGSTTRPNVMQKLISLFKR